MIRQLLAEITGTPGLVARIGPGQDLLSAGIGSGDVIRLVAALEERHGIEVGAAELDRLHTIAAFEQYAADAAERLEQGAGRTR
jgi:acyl carrier protein